MGTKPEPGATPAPAVATVDAVTRLLLTHAFLHADEDALQAGIAEALTVAGYAPRREVRLTPRDRIDILVGRIGIEVKVGGTAIAAFKQCQRYAHSPEVDALVLVTTRVAHAALPASVGGKPFTVVALAGRF